MIVVTAGLIEDVRLNPSPADDFFFSCAGPGREWNPFFTGCSTSIQTGMVGGASHGEQAAQVFFQNRSMRITGRGPRFRVVDAVGWGYPMVPTKVRENCTLLMEFEKRRKRSNTEDRVCSPAGEFQPSQFKRHDCGA